MYICMYIHIYIYIHKIFCNVRLGGSSRELYIWESPPINSS